MDQVELVFVDGKVRFIHSDEAMEIVAGLGPATISRASHVEPGPDNNWYSDLGPVGGPTLGPFARRQDALDAEVEWLRENHLHCARCVAAGSPEGVEDAGTEKHRPADQIQGQYRPE